MTLLEQYIDCMKKGNNVALSELFEEKGVLHDSSVNKVCFFTAFSCFKNHFYDFSDYQ